MSVCKLCEKKVLKLQTYLFLSAAIAFLSLLPGCTGASVKENTEIQEEAENILEKDPYFQEPPMEQEVFRILITEDGYYYKNISDGSRIDRKPDPGGDGEQYKKFRKYNDEYNFKDWVLTAVLKARLNPHRGELEHIEYIPGHNPKTWQSGKLFQEDLSRFDFIFPENEITMYEFLVRYEWRIPREPGLSEEDAKRRAIEFLNSQVRGR